MRPFVGELERVLRGRILPDEPLARHTTFRIGGPVEAMVLPADAQDLAACLEVCAERGLPCRVVGEGSNLLVTDRPLAGVVVRLKGPRFDFIEEQRGGDVCRLRVGAGLAVARLVAHAGREGLEDLVFFAGIPGNLGGALWMNAGTTAGQVSDVLEIAELALPTGELVELTAEQCGLEYRRSSLPPGAVAHALRLRSKLTDPAPVRARIDRYLERRRRTQPSGRTAGCSFKNPEGEHAGRLIDQAGLRGLSEGRATVSDRHANFIVAKGEARAQDVLRLMGRVRSEIHERHGLWLEPEVQMVGFDDEELALLYGGAPEEDDAA